MHLHVKKSMPVTKRFTIAIALTGIALSLFLVRSLARSANALTNNDVAGCRVENLMPEFRQFLLAYSHADRAQQRNAFTRLFIVPHAELYNTETLGNGGPQSRGLDEFLKDMPADVSRIHTISRIVQDGFPKYVMRFRGMFPRFTCAETIYFYPALYAFDGAVRTVDGHPALLFGVDTIAEIYNPTDVQILFDHELLHRYNAHETGVEAAAPGNRLYLPLWSEGLAVYVSHVMNPEVPLYIALGRPSDMQQRAFPLRAKLAREFMRVFDSTSFEDYATYFEGGASHSGFPSRAGYYLGYLVVTRIAAETHANLPALAQLHGSRLRSFVWAQLQQISRSD